MLEAYPFLTAAYQYPPDVNEWESSLSEREKITGNDSPDGSSRKGILNERASVSRLRNAHDAKRACDTVWPIRFCSVSSAAA